MQDILKMDELPWWAGGIGFVLASWLYMNHWYRRIHGRRLRWTYLWAAHGAVLLGRRFPEWEKR